jgi:hypothetical protein
MRGERWPLDRVKRELSDQMSRAFDLLVEGSADSFREAAFDRAVLNIAEALRAG